MSKSFDDAPKELDAVLQALQRSLVESSTDDVIKELQAAGIDPLKAMQTMRFAEDRALEDHFREVRERLARERADTLRDVNSTARQLPSSRQEMLDLLTSVCAKYGPSMTAQFRELTSFADIDDAELGSMLKHLAALGYLNDEK